LFLKDLNININSMSLERRPEKPALPRSFDELNLARLSLISMQSRVSRDTYGWEDAYPEAGDHVSVKCIGTLEYLVPHGIDNDIMIGIQNMFLSNGCPANNAVSDTANSYLRWAGLDTSGRYHRNLKESLMRLSHTSYHVERGWFTGKRFQTVVFRHLHEIAFDTAEAGGGFDQGSRITVVLPTAIAESLRRGYIKPLDAQVLAVLEQPSSRTLYRLLDGSRYDPGRPGQPISNLQMNLITWGRRARILDLTPARVKRTLEAAHEELLKSRYLSSVEYAGRGVNTTISYVFAHHAETKDPELYDRLILHGVSPKMTRELIKNFGNETVRARLDEAESLSQGRRKTGPGFLVAFIRVPEDYRGRFVAPPVPEQTKVSVANTPFQPALLSLPRVPEVDPDVQANEKWEAMTHSERVKSTVLLLKVAFGKRFTGGQYESMREAMEVDALPIDLMRKITIRAMAEASQDGCAALIRQQLYEVNSLGTS
jgi:plasmid replication initiation protein